MAVSWLTPIDRQFQPIMLTVSGAALFLMGALLFCLDLYLAKDGAARELSRQADLVGVLRRKALLTQDQAAGRGCTPHLCRSARRGPGRSPV